MAEPLHPIQETRAESRRRSAASTRPTIWRRIRFFLLIGIAFLILHNVTGFMRVSGNSMLPTLQDGDILLMDKLSMLVRKPEYGDVVIIRSESIGYNIVKRVLAVEGDVVSITNGVTYVNGQPLVELYTYGSSEDMAEIRITEGHIFAAGDHRTLGESLDSRDSRVGQIHLSEIRSFVALSLWPFHSIAKPLKL